MSIINTFKALNGADFSSNNTTTASITKLPVNILEAFIPGYSIISGFLNDVLGFDVTLVVSVALLLFGLVTGLNFLWRHAWYQFQVCFTSTITIESHDDIYDHVMEWLTAHEVTGRSRSLMAATGRQNAWDLDSSLDDDFDEDEDEVDTTELLNFSNWDAKVPPNYRPYFGTERFWFKGHYFKFSRDAKTMMYAGWGGSTVFSNDETITLTCIGRSTEPIKELIQEARDNFLNKERACTVVRRPAPKDQRGHGRGVWHRVATRPSRPMNTVILDHDEKDRILSDINEYLHPATPRWYANRGIPYRRGYLFAGPPGTGKSSLAWAIAGIFGLDIYCISLVEPSLTEEDLGLMFTSLPRRCVVLLEDIDSAGLIKRQEPSATSTDSEKQDEAAKIGAEISKAISTAQQNNKGSKENQGISLSGLLNAIDGVASHEGRVLVMTSNFPDKLDDALIRPGRIDMRIDFTRATRMQIVELFTRMYLPDNALSKASLTSEPKKPEPVTKPSTLTQRKNSKVSFALSNGTAKTPDVAGTVLTPPDSPRVSLSKASSTGPSLSSTNMTPLSNGTTKPTTTPPSSLTSEELNTIANDFADKLPEDTFTPAEIQGFLLTRKKEPLRALQEVEEWKGKTLKAKEYVNPDIPEPRYWPRGEPDDSDDDE